MTTLRAAAIDIDGVLLEDTFSPVIKAIVEKNGGIYDREIERNVFSQNRQKAAEYLLARLGLSVSVADFVKSYFEERELYIRKHGGGPRPGMTKFLEILRDSELRLVCYGGLPNEYFKKELAEWQGFFEGYVCTNDFRPGVREITTDILEMSFDQVLFFDDVSRVAEEAKHHGVPFVGVPASFPWGFQKDDMIKLGVRRTISELSEVTPAFLVEIDDDCTRKQIW